MMAIFPFTPSVSFVFSFQPTLDGQVYNATVPYPVFSNRPYLNLVALDGTLIWYGAVIGSPVGVAIEALTWANGRVTVTTLQPHGYDIARVKALTVAGCTPDAYNGLWPCLVTGPSALQFDLANDPGGASTVGSLSYDIDILGGVAKPDGSYFASTLVFRAAAQQFEASP